MEVDYAKNVLQPVVGEYRFHRYKQLLLSHVSQCPPLTLPVHPPVAVLSFVVGMLNLLLNVIRVAFPIVLSAWHQDPKIPASDVVIDLLNVWNSWYICD